MSTISVHRANGKYLSSFIIHYFVSTRHAKPSIETL